MKKKLWRLKHIFRLLTSSPSSSALPPLAASSTPPSASASGSSPPGSSEHGYWASPPPEAQDSPFSVQRKHKYWSPTLESHTHMEGLQQ